MINHIWNIRTSHLNSLEHEPNEQLGIQLFSKKESIQLYLILKIKKVHNCTNKIKGFFFFYES